MKKSCGDEACKEVVIPRDRSNAGIDIIDTKEHFKRTIGGFVGIKLNKPAPP